MNIFKFWLPESRVNASLHIFLSPLLLSSLLLTNSNRDDKLQQGTDHRTPFSSLIIFVFKNIYILLQFLFLNTSHVTEESTFFHPCYHLSSLLLLVGNRDDSIWDDKKYTHSHLLCFLKAKT